MRERALETLASTGQCRHHRANGDGGNGSDLLIRTAFQFAEDQHLAETWRQRFEGAREALTVRSSDSQGLGRHAGLGMQLFVKFGHEFHRANRERSEEHTSELQSHLNLVCRLLL